MTQKEIASILGISRTTVARALKGDESIKPETRNKILKLCKEVGYKKNYIGSILANNKNKIIYAFLVKSKNKLYLDEITEGLEVLKKEVLKYNISLEIIISDINKPKEQILKLETILKYKDVDGIIITPMLKDEVINVLKNYPTIPLVSLDKKINDEISFIGSDYKKSGIIIGGILTKLANVEDKIIVIKSDDDNISSNVYMEGFSESLNSSGLKNIEIKFIKNLSNNLDEILKIKDIEKAKYLYTTRYVDKVASFLDDSNLKNIKLIVNGIDINTTSLIEKEQVIVATKENYFLQAYLAGKIIFNKLNGKDKKINYTTKPEIIFKENINEIEKNHERIIFKNFNIL